MICSKCRKTKPIKARGRCGSCYSRWLRQQKACGRDVLINVEESGVRRRVVDLLDSETGPGFSPRDVAQLSNLSLMVIQKIYRIDEMQVQRVNPETARAVLNVKPAELWQRGEIERTKIRLATSGNARGVKCVSLNNTRSKRLIRVEGSTRRLQALAVAGWSREYLSKKSNLDQWNVIGPIMRGKESKGVGKRAPREWTTAETALIISDLYDELSMKNPRVWDGGRGFDAKTARNAINRGWLPALAWDDDLGEGPGCIDDPHDAAIPNRKGRARTKTQLLIDQKTAVAASRARETQDA